MAEKLPYDVPKYPCVIFLAKTKHIRYTLPRIKDEGGDQRDGGDPTEDLEYLHHRVRDYDDMQHVDFCRKHKGFAVVAYHNLDFTNPHPDIVDRDTGKIKEGIVRLRSELDGFIAPPELRLAEAAKAKAEADTADKEALDERSKRARRGAGES